MVASTLGALVRLFLAPACAACGGALEQPLTSPVCGPCWHAVLPITAPLCARCGDALPSSVCSTLCARCTRRMPAFALARSGGRYEGSLRKIVHAFKYDGRRVLAPSLAALMCEAGRDVLAGADAVVPVPLHPWRAMQRGFNQADDLAVHLGLPVWRVLGRTKHGPPLASLPAARRHGSVRGAFRARRRITAGIVVLVDDVMTTGATLEACGRALSDAGVRTVRALTAARAVVPRRARPLQPPGPAAGPH